MRTSRTAKVAWAGWALLLPCSSPAFAAEPTKGELTAARALFAEGEADEEAGRWGEALTKIRRASTVKMTPGLRFHIALCEEHVGQLVPALDDYSAAQAAAQRENNRDVLDQVVQPLAALRARVPTLTLNLHPSLIGASGLEVLVDGAPFPSGLWGAAVPVEVGSHTIRARAPGRAAFGTTVSVVPRQAVTVDIRLEPLAPSAPPATGQASARLSGAPAAQESILAPSTAHSHTLAIATTVGAVVLVGAGLGAFAVAGGDQSTAAAQCAAAPACVTQRSAIRAWDAVALTSWIVGAGAATAAVILWTRPGHDPSSPHAALGIAPGEVSLSGTF